MTRGVLAILAALVYVFLLAPFFVVALASLEGSQGLFFNFPPRQLSLAWYGEIPPKYFRAFGLSLLVGTVSALIAGSVGTAAALGVVRGRVRRQPLVQAFFRLPLQVPFVVVRLLPTSGVPETTGGCVFEGAVELRLVAAMAAAARIDSASKAAAAITRGLTITGCRNRGCQGNPSMCPSSVDDRPPTDPAEAAGEATSPPREQQRRSTGRRAGV